MSSPSLSGQPQKQIGDTASTTNSTAVTPPLHAPIRGPDYRQIADFIREFTTENDRACVILSAAKIDYLCGQILAKFLLPNSGTQDELLDIDRPLGTFSARTAALFRFGIIDNEFSRALTLFRRLRNSFAHEVSGSTFDEGGHKDRICELARPFTEFEDYEGFRVLFAQGKTGTATHFYAAAAILITHLEGVLHVLTPIGFGNPASIRPRGWKPLSKK